MSESPASEIISQRFEIINQTIEIQSQNFEFLNKFTF